MVTLALILTFRSIVLRGHTADRPLLKATPTGSRALKEQGRWKIRILPQTHQENSAERLQATGVTRKASGTILEPQNH